MMMVLTLRRLTSQQEFQDLIHPGDHPRLFHGHLNRGLKFWVGHVHVFCVRAGRRKGLSCVVVLDGLFLGFVHLGFEVSVPRGVEDLLQRFVTKVIHVHFVAKFYFSEHLAIHSLVVATVLCPLPV